MDYFSALVIPYTIKIKIRKIIPFTIIYGAGVIVIKLKMRLIIRLIIKNSIDTTLILPVLPRPVKLTAKIPDKVTNATIPLAMVINQI